jgi:HD-GYP domain-containing protein (c-di-GMP phosphodiesterase class II)
MNNISPKKIHRKLIFRISLMGLLIALLSGTIIWQVEKGRIDQSILLRTERAFKRLNNQIRPLLNTPADLNPRALREELIHVLSRREVIQLGQYVWIGIYDLHGQPVTVVRDDTYENVELLKTITGRITEAAAPHGKMEFDINELNHIPHIQIIAPLYNEEGEKAALGETVFAVAEEALAAIRARALRLALAAMAIVILTTALIYPVVITLLNQVSSLSAKLFDANLEILKVLGSTIAKRDSDTDAHNYRVSIISVKLAEHLGLSADTIQCLIKGAFLHDVGKIGIEDGILHKPGRLTDDEFTVMQTHVPLGLDIVDKAEWIKDGMDIVGCHHEKYDGSGYARGLAGDQIPATARIFAIADVFDALTSQRPYKEPFSYEKTMDILKSGRGSHFDPNFVDVFETMSRSVYETYAGREDDDLKKELDAIIKKYFYA